MIFGKAAPDGTNQYAQRFPQLTYQPLFPGGPWVSQAGFGTYRTTSGIESHQQALTHALKQGINLIDTSSNYGDGRSEQLVGEVVAALIDHGTLSRESVVIVSKGGYIQGDNLAVVQMRKQSGTPFPNVVQYAEGLSHCIHPEFLADQIQRSLERLQMDCIDGYLLHNPEYYLMWAAKWNHPLAQAQQIYYQRLRMAFSHLEEEVTQGRIQWYGISSNTFPHPAQDPTFTSLTKVLEIAQAVSPDHHFRLIQFPMNLLERGAATEINQPGERHLLSLAREAGVGTLVNRPLNAFNENRLTRLANTTPPSYPTTTQEVSTAVDTLVTIEIKFQQELLPGLPLPAEAKRSLLEYLSIGRILQGQWRGFDSYQNWGEVQSRFLIPRAHSALQTLSSQPNSPPELVKWIEGYVDAVDIASTAVGAFYQERAHAEAEAIQEIVDRVEPEWAAGSLSQTVVRALRSTAGVSSVLVGMRQQPYVDDILTELASPCEHKPRDSSWQALAEALPPTSPDPNTL